MKLRLLKITLFVVMAAFISVSAKAVTCYALTDTNHLLTFDSATPGTVNDVAITGLPVGNELVGMAMRITTKPNASNAGVGSLWALCEDSGDYKLFVINAGNGAATQVGGILTALGVATVSSNNWGFAFDPGTDSFQAVGFFYNFWIDPNTATAIRRPNVYTVDSMNVTNMFPAFSGAAFTTTSFGGTSTFYICDTGIQALAKSADIDAGGAISTFGQMNYGIGVSGGPNGIAIYQGTALFAPNTTHNLYSMNLSTGVATMIGALATGGADVRSLVIRPTSFPAPFAVTVKIKGPKKVATTKTSLVIKGTATSAAGIPLVQYKVGKGKFKTASGTTSWKFKAKLKPGVNTISVQATGGNSVKSSIAKIKVKVSAK